MTPSHAAPRICLVGLENLPVLSGAHATHGIGGEQVQQTLLARAFVRRGLDVHMVVADYGQPEGLRIDGITLHKAYRLQAGWPGLRFVHPRLTGLWRALVRADAQAYYVSIAGPHVGIVALFAGLHGRRLVFRIASDADCDPRRVLIREARNRWLYAYGLRHASVILSQTSAQAMAMQASYGVASRPAAMLVDTPPPPRDFHSRDIDVLWVGNLLPLKRPSLALDLARRAPGLQVHLVGGAQPGHEGLFRAIETEAKALPNVHFHGRLPYEETAALFDRARVLVNTSDTEGFPNVYLQAWCRGTPVVTFIDPDRVIERCGLGACVDGMNSMTRRVRHLARAEMAWRAASQRCRRHVHDHHAEDAVLPPYLRALLPAEPRTAPMLAGSAGGGTP